MKLTRFNIAGAVSLLALALIGTALAEETKEYTAAEAAKHVGEKATVTGKIEDVHRAQGGNIFMNMGGRHPNEVFTAFIAAKNADKFTDVEKFDGAVISVTGEIKMHQEKPEIIVTDPSQIVQKEKK